MYSWDDEKGEEDEKTHAKLTHKHRHTHFNRLFLPLANTKKHPHLSHTHKNTHTTNKYSIYV